MCAIAVAGTGSTDVADRAQVRATAVTAAGRAAATEYELARTFPVEVGEPSGLAYDPKTNTLWTVSDGGGGLSQLNTRGEPLREMDFTSNDLEGIAYKPATDTFLLAEERTREILEIDRQGKILWVAKVPTDYSWWNLLQRNHGIEGVAYDQKSGSIFVVNEKSPRVVIELIEGDVITRSRKAFRPSISDSLGLTG